MELIKNSNKPLGHRSYGSIPHLPGSRLGPGDYHIHEGQAKIATEKVRDKHDRVIVQEKLDGSNVAVAKINGEILAITRAGYLANTSKYQQHLLFDAWVNTNRTRFNSLLTEGERICGEWLAQAHGTIYNLPHEPFVAFDIIKDKNRIIFDQLTERTRPFDLILPCILGFGPMSIETALDKLGYGQSIFHNMHGSVDSIEGAIWRVERNGKVDFLAKFVHHGKEDGKYLPEKNGTGMPIFNTWPKRHL
jgi:hypothetical protein